MTAAYSGVEKLLIQPFYLAEQHAVNGSHNELDAGGLNATYEFSPSFKLTGFIYRIEGTGTGNANASNRTIGLRASSSFQIEGQSFTYAASLAEQEAIGPSTVTYDAGYLAADLSTVLEGFSLGGGFESFEPGFRTPLATVHKFNGFADALLATNGFTNGLKDFYAYLGYVLPVGNGIEAK